MPFCSFVESNFPCLVWLSQWNISEVSVWVCVCAWGTRSKCACIAFEWSLLCCFTNAFHNILFYGSVVRYSQFDKFFLPNWLTYRNNLLYKGSTWLCPCFDSQPSSASLWTTHNYYYRAKELVYVQTVCSNVFGASPCKGVRVLDKVPPNVWHLLKRKQCWWLYLLGVVCVSPVTALPSHHLLSGEIFATRFSRPLSSGCE